MQSLFQAPSPSVCWSKAVHNITPQLPAACCLSSADPRGHQPALLHPSPILSATTSSVLSCPPQAPGLVTGH